MKPPYQQNIMLSFRCNDDLAEWLDECAERIGVHRSEFIRAALYNTNPKVVAHEMIKSWDKKKSDKNR